MSEVEINLQPGFPIEKTPIPSLLSSYQQLKPMTERQNFNLQRNRFPTKFKSGQLQNRSNEKTQPPQQSKTEKKNKKQKNKLYKQMSYVQQICDGYNKKSLMGNWYEERLYPDQPFREKQEKHVRDKDQGITCFDNTGFQRQLPRLERRHKWETSGRIVLNDGLNEKVSVMRAEYPHGEQQSSVTEMRRPFAKVSDDVKGTSIHPHSQLKNIQKSYHYLNNKNAEQLSVPRDVLLYGSDFRSTLPQHPPAIKQTHFDTIYRNSYNNPQREDSFTKTNSEFHRTRNSAGQFDPNREQSVRNISTLVGENKKQVGDQKQRTEIQRSWVPPKDPGLAHSMGKTSKDFKNKNIPTNDIQTSLNMNIGIHNIHPKDVNDNYFRHIRQDVTIQPNRTFCSRP